MSTRSVSDLAAFKQNVTTLTELGQNRDLSKLVPLAARKASVNVKISTQLPLDIERRLAQDFAFIAAWRTSGNFVSAASIVVSRNGELQVNIAANQGIPQPAATQIRSLCSIVSECANQRISRSQCEDRLLETMVKLHANRLLWRIGSPKYVQEERRINSIQRPLGTKLVELKDAIMNERCDPRHDKSLLIARIDTLMNEVSKVNQGNKQSFQADLARLVRAAHELFSTQNEFIGQGFPRHVFGIERFRQVRAIANYWRICVFISAASRSHRDILRTLDLNIVRYGTPDMPVHAEIQLLVFHEIRRKAPKPRVIVSSKLTCFLCDTFFRCHGQYLINPTHGQAYKRWNLPEMTSLPPMTRARLAEALQKTAKHVESTIKALKKRPKGKSGNVQAQSVVNMNLPKLRTPSVSTLYSDRQMHDEILPDADDSEDLRELLHTPIPDSVPTDDVKRNTVVTSQPSLDPALPEASTSAVITTAPATSVRQATSMRPRVDSVHQYARNDQGNGVPVDLTTEMSKCMDPDPPLSSLESPAKQRLSSDVHEEPVSKERAVTSAEENWNPEIQRVIRAGTEEDIESSWLRMHVELENIAAPQTGSRQPQFSTAVCEIGPATTNRASTVMIDVARLPFDTDVVFEKQDTERKLFLYMSNNGNPPILTALQWDR